MTNFMSKVNTQDQNTLKNMDKIHNYLHFTKSRERKIKVIFEFLFLIAFEFNIEIIFYRN